MDYNTEFDKKPTKELLTKLNFEYFLNRNIREEKYTEENIQKLYSSFKSNQARIRMEVKENPKQFNYFCEGQVRKMFTGGLLTSHFNLDDTRELTIIDFAEYGTNWAYFMHWQQNQKNQLKKEKIWNSLIKTGAILGIILSIMKLFEILHIFGAK